MTRFGLILFLGLPTLFSPSSYRPDPYPNFSICVLLLRFKNFRLLNVLRYPLLVISIVFTPACIIILSRFMILYR